MHPDSRVPLDAVRVHVGMVHGPPSPPTHRARSSAIAPSDLTMHGSVSSESGPAGYGVARGQRRESEDAQAVACTASRQSEPAGRVPAEVWEEEPSRANGQGQGQGKGLRQESGRPADQAFALQSSGHSTTPAAALVEAAGTVEVRLTQSFL